MANNSLIAFCLRAALQLFHRALAVECIAPLAGVSCLLLFPGGHQVHAAVIAAIIRGERWPIIRSNVFFHSEKHTKTITEATGTKTTCMHFVYLQHNVSFCHTYNAFEMKYLRQILRVGLLPKDKILETERV